MKNEEYYHTNWSNSPLQSTIANTYFSICIPFHLDKVYAEVINFKGWKTQNMLSYYNVIKLEINDSMIENSQIFLNKFNNTIKNNPQVKGDTTKENGK